MGAVSESPVLRILPRSGQDVTIYLFLISFPKKSTDSDCDQSQDIYGSPGLEHRKSMTVLPPKISESRRGVFELARPSKISIRIKKKMKFPGKLDIYFCRDNVRLTEDRSPCIRVPSRRVPGRPRPVGRRTTTPRLARA